MPVWHRLFIAALACMAAWLLGPGIKLFHPAKAASTYYVRTDGSDTLCNGSADLDASFFPTCAFQTIGKGVLTAVSGDTLNVAEGTYTENVTLNEMLTLKGVQAGVSGCGEPENATIITPSNPAVRTLELQTGSAGTIINGFTFAGGTRSIESTSGPLNNLQIINNRFTGFTDAGLFLNHAGTDITVFHNGVDGSSKTGSGGLVNLGTATFDGFYFTSNCTFNGALAGTGTGFFVNGNRNVLPSGNRSPLFDGNLIAGNAVGVNSGSRAFQGVRFSNNTLSDNTSDGYQGGPKDSMFNDNTFSGNGHSGVALTSFGNTDSLHGAQNSTFKQNLISGNGFTNAGEGVFFSATQAAGTIATNHVIFNRIAGNRVGATYNGTETIALDVQNNWWGCNYGPGAGGAGCSGAPNGLNGTGAAKLDANPWLTLTLSPAMPPSVPQFGTSALTAKLTINSDGTDTAAAMCFVPNNTPITFSAMLGTVSPAGDGTVNGVLNATYTGLTPGNDTASALLDEQTVSTPIMVQCPAITGTVSGGTGEGAVCAGQPSTVTVTVSGGAPPYTVTLTNGGGTQMGAGPTLNFTVSPAMTTSYQLAAGSHGADNCAITNSGSAQVMVVQSPATPTITPNPPQVCANSTGNQASGPAGATTYAWSISNGTITSALNGQTISYTAGAAGNVTLNLTVTNASECSASNSINVPITPATPAITPNPAQVCANSTGNQASGPAGATTYAWTISNGTLSSANNLQTITYTAGNSGNVTLMLTVTNASGCSASNSITVPINPSPATPTITPTPTQVCANSTGNQASGPAGAATYAWTVTNGTLTTAANLQTITYTAGAAGNVTLNLTVTNAAGCNASNSTSVTINPIPTCNITGASPVASGSTTSYTATSSLAGSSFSWTISGNGTIAGPTNNASVNVVAGAAGSFTLTSTVTSNGCSSTCAKTVTVAGPPAISKAFGSASLLLNGTTSLSFTINNPNPSVALTGLAFSDTLPGGLVVATPPNVSGACGGTVTAAAGGSTISLAGGTLAAAGSCSFSLNVTGTTPGTKNNTTGPISSTNGGTGATSNTASLTVFPISFSVTDPLACTGPGNSVSGVFTITNSSAATVAVSATVMLPAGLVGVPGACVASTGACAVNAASVGYTLPALGAGQTATVTYLAQVGDLVTAGATLCSNLTVTFGSGPALPPLQACVTVNCPTVGPGALFPAASEVSDQKAGSVLVYNLYASSGGAPNTQNTRINLTNTHPRLRIAVHLFFVDGATCSIADSLVCLTPNQTASFLASDFDPGTTGYIIAVASNLATGCPVNFNYLIGDAYLKLSSNHAANLTAEGIAAIAGGLPFCDGFSVTAQLNFDGISYNRVPRVLAASNIPARPDGNDTLIVLNRFGGNLAVGAATLTSLFGILYDDAEKPVSFTFNPGVCQFRSALSNSFPRTTPRFEQFIPAGRSGWAKFYSLNDQALFGAQLNFNANAGTSAGVFNQGHNLHKLTLTPTVVLTIPVFPPHC